jgi:hypothetical protein
MTVFVRERQPATERQQHCAAPLSTRQPEGLPVKPGPALAWSLASITIHPRTPEIQRDPDPDAPVTPTLIKSRPGDLSLIKDPFPKGSLDEKQWTENRSKPQMLISDIAKIAQAEKVFVGLASVAKVDDDIHVVDAKSSTPYLPGLNYAPLTMDRGLTAYVAEKGGPLIDRLTPSRGDPLPKIAVALGSAALASKELALTTLRHELMHAEHLKLALNVAKKWIDSKSKDSFDDWFEEQKKKKKAMSELDVDLVTGAVKFKRANTELLAHAEGFMTRFLLAQPPPAKDNDDAFEQLYGMFMSSSEPWSAADESARAEALGRLQEYFCHTLDGPHQDAFKHFVENAAKEGHPSIAPGWDWHPKSQKHEQFFASLQKITDAQCKDLGGMKTKSPAGAKKK